jgi:YHS domain-containing protein
MHLALVALTLVGQETEPRPLALRGLDPVELVAGREVLGDVAHVHDRNGFRYAFASEESAETFESDPGHFEIQYGGGCGRMGPLSGRGDPDRYLVHDGRIYVFASDACRESFRKAPDAHVDRAEPPSGDAAARERGAELLAKVVEAVGGAEAVDSVRRVRVASAGGGGVTGSSHAWREECEYTYGDTGSGATALARTSTQDGWSWREELDSVLRAGQAGGTLTPESWAARHEFELQLSRDLVFLLRQRTNTYGFAAWGAGPVNTEGRTLEALVVGWNGRNTTLLVEPGSGRVLRMRWRGRLDAGPNGDVQVDFDDFGPVGGLTLPRARRVTFDGAPVEQRSGVLALLEVD